MEVIYTLRYPAGLFPAVPSTDDVIVEVTFPNATPHYLVDCVGIYDHGDEQIIHVNLLENLPDGSMTLTFVQPTFT